MKSHVASLIPNFTFIFTCFTCKGISSTFPLFSHIKYNFTYVSVCRSDPREAKAQFQIRFSALALYDVNKRGNPQQGDLSNTAQAVSTKSPPTDVLPH